MSRLVTIAAVALQGFFRCGMAFPQRGKVVDLNALDEGVFDRLKAEPMLRISEPTEEDLARFQKDGVESEAEQRFAIMEAIRELEADDFQANGKPKIDALKEVLGKGAKVNADLRDEIWEEMVEGGFTAPAD